VLDQFATVAMLDRGLIGNVGRMVFRNCLACQAGVIDGHGYQEIFVRTSKSYDLLSPGLMGREGKSIS
jgi:hypothetical protein